MSDPTTAWARDVVDGRIISGHLMRRACERHLRDIVDGPRRGLYWRPEKAAHALGFFPAVLSVTAGTKTGEPFELPSYTTFVVGSLFGWMRASGVRRFRHCWLELGKGQIKSPLMAAIGLYVLGYCGIARSEVYAIAKDRNQANVLFMDAVRMVEAQIPGTGDSLVSRGDVIIRGTGEMSWMIEHPEMAGKFRALAGDEKVNGPRPSLVLGDEIHEWRSSGAIDTWQAALTKMPGDALLILGTNTPAADQLIGTQYSEQYQQILRQEVDDDSAFALIARTDPDDKPMDDPSCWRKALPVLGLTYPEENVHVAVNAARHRIAATLAVKRLYFGVPVGASEYWIDLEAWERAQGEVSGAGLADRPCWLSMDLSLKNDLTAMGCAWLREDGKLLARVEYWKPAEGIADAARSDNAPYGEWAASGLLNLVPGASISYDEVATKVREFVVANNVRCMAFDPARISDFRQACERIGFQTWLDDGKQKYGGVGLRMVIHSQGAQGMHSKNAFWMPRSLQILEDEILGDGIEVDASPVTKWCAGNAAVEERQGNRWFVKKRSRGRIDGLTALAMVVGAARAVEAPDNLSDQILARGGFL
jgi:phage terminase large subunit-like protein